MTKIIADDLFERFRLFEEESKTNQLASQMIGDIFKKFFHNTEVNPDNFYFSVYDDDSNNAFFIKREDTVEQKKDVIVVSRGLIEECQNEAELAGIIGHECGHFLWKELIKGQNTIFQEHAADLYAVDLLRNGGYNPRHHLEICKRILTDYGKTKYTDITLDVHGNGQFRVDDINDYMTKIASEEGDFPPLDKSEDTNYKNFKASLKQAFAEEGYDTYIEKCFKRELGTKNRDEISAEDAMRVMLSEMEQGNISIDKTTRFQEMFFIVSRYQEKGAFENKTPEFTELCQKFFMESYRQIEDPFAHARLKTLRLRSEADYMKSIRNNHNWMLKGFSLEKFGDFATQTENIEHFVHYKDKQDAIHWAEEMYKLRWTLDYAHCFTDDKYPHFEAKKEQNVGKMLPWHELEKFVREENNHELAWALSKTMYISTQHYQDYYSRETDDNNYHPKLYFLDPNGIVLAYGEDAVKMHENADLASANREFLSKCAEQRDMLDNNIRIYNALASFEMAKTAEEKEIHAQEFLAIMDKSGYEYAKLPLFYGTRNNNPAYLRNPEIEKMQEIYYDSLTHKYFTTEEDKPSHDIQNRANKYQREEKEKRMQEPNEKFIAVLDEREALENILALSNISANIYQKEKICSAIFDMADYFQKKEDGKNAYKTYMFAKNHVEKNFRIDRADYHITDSEEYKNLRAQYEERTEKLRYTLNQLMVSSPTTIEEYMIKRNDSGVTPLDTVALEELKNETLNSSPLLDKTMETMGFNPNEPFSETLSRLDDYIGKHVKLITGYDNSRYRSIIEDKQINNSLYDEKYLSIYNIEREQPGYPLINLFRGAGVLMLANNIKRGNQWDLKETMKYLRLSSSNSYYNPLISDMIAESIQEGDKFNQLTLEDKIYVYEVMEHLNLFSEKYANKNEFFKTITKEILEYPDHDKAIEYTEKLLSEQYAELDFTRKKDKKIEFAREKDLLIKFYAKGKSDELGIDDGSDEFFARASSCAEKICAEITLLDDYGNPSQNKAEKFPRDILKDILNEISNNVVSQELTAQMLADKGNVQISDKDADKYDIYARGALALVSALAGRPDDAKVMIDFLSSKCTDKSMEKVFASIPETQQLKLGKPVKINDSGLGSFSHNFVFDKAALQMLHENFWAVSLPARAYIMKRIMSAYTGYEETKEEKDKKKLDLIVDMYFDKKSEYYKDAKKVVSAVYNNLQEYEQDLILGALVAANQKDDNNQKTGGEAVGEGLKMFFEHKGPAFVKFGQMLSYLPQLDPDIRRPLAKLRDKADLPTRDVLFNLLKETLPNEELAKISRVDKILGAGSFFITAKVKYDEKDCVIAIMRPYAKELSASGMNMINNTIACLAKKDSKFKPLQNIAYQAKISSESETDIEADYQKYLEAIKIYDDLKITTKSGEFTPKVAKWESYGSGKDGKVYKIMDMAEGNAMTSSKMSEQQKHDAAVAYVTVELCNLLSGARWDTDRHQGQQNFSADGEHEDGFKKFVIGIFDTGAQIQHDPDKKDKILLGEMLYGMARAARLGRNISDYMISKVKRIDKVGKRLNIDTLYIDEVQRGLTALSDIITYQKEQKDENGNIIQEEKSLSGKEIGEIANSILESGLVDKTVMKTIKVKAILNKLRPLRRGWITSLSEGIKKIAPTIKIEKNENIQNNAHAVMRKDKPEEEILKCQEKEKSKRVLGVNTRHIRRSQEHDVSLSSAFRQKNTIFQRMRRMLKTEKV